MLKALFQLIILPEFRHLASHQLPRLTLIVDLWCIYVITFYSYNSLFLQIVDPCLGSNLIGKLIPASNWSIHQERKRCSLVPERKFFGSDVASCQISSDQIAVNWQRRSDLQLQLFGLHPSSLKYVRGQGREKFGI